MRLIFVKQMLNRIQKPPACLIVVGLLILPVVLLANLSSGAPSSLRNTIRHRGDWHVLKADAATIFDMKSSEIWPELIRRFTANRVYLKPEDGNTVSNIDNHRG